MAAPHSTRAKSSKSRMGASAFVAKTNAVQTIGPVRQGTVDRRRQLWLDATAEIERRYAEPLTVAEVARSIGTSTRQLQRVFDEVGGRSFRAHVAAVRMDRARRPGQQQQQHLEGWCESASVGLSWSASRREPSRHGGAGGGCDARGRTVG